jgi:phage repressor protein C with HTH and peptisase S24 domain
MEVKIEGYACLKANNGNCDCQSQLAVMSEQSFSDRLKELIGSESANAFARRVGITESLLRKYLAGGTPGIDKAAMICAGAGVTLDWLIAGVGPKRAYRHEGASSSPSAATSDREFAMIPRLAVEASAGNGALAHHEESAGMVAFRSDWLRRMGISPHAARALTAKGDSMEPTIRDGDILLVDTSIDRIRDNALYVVVLGGLVLVKRVHVKRDGSLTLISDNSVFPPEDVPAGETSDLSIAGRVMWFGRSI